MYLNEFLGDVRRAQHISQAEIARRADLSKAAWHGIENGRSHPQIATLVQVGEVMGFETVIHVSRNVFVVKSHDGKIILEPTIAPLAKQRHALRTLATLTPEQVGIVAQVALLLRP